MNATNNIGRRIRITDVANDPFRKVLLGHTGRLIPPSKVYRTNDPTSDTDMAGDYWARLDSGQAPYHPFGMTMLKPAEKVCISPGQFEYLDAAD